ncbi:hypothetical protein [Noviherbaspirillum galbum]|uniref:Proline-rich protein n=1 Tax=Noviherbaspirillum galbum TaxID=2709383 RepID=A0A6B3SFW9_9BURK|nr:hypothetical protein [Noviherbaspirillum galbum]NEX59731.1 hypothetical protein [Noviherbaspirillum galbum]
MNTVYDKTEKGRDEIATRKYRLTPRLRTLLVLIDGKHTAGDLLKTVGGLGLTDASFTELLAEGYIESTAAAAPAPVIHITTPEGDTLPPLAEDTTLSIADLPVESQPVVTDAERFQRVYAFFNETIKSNMGLRGYALQLKVEKAGTLEELRALRRPYLEGVLKAKGNEVARALRDRLDKLLGEGESEGMGSTLLAEFGDAD